MVAVGEFADLFDQQSVFPERYSGYVVVITDERGEIIQHAESSKWLFENLDNLRKLSVGSYMNKNCEHASPVGPSSYYY